MNIASQNDAPAVFSGYLSPAAVCCSDGESVLVGHTSHFLWELQSRNAPCGNQPAADVCVCQTQTKQQPPGMKSETDAEVI